MCRILLISIFSMMTLFAQSQNFDTDTILLNGPTFDRINLIIISEGYQESELDKFSADAIDFSEELFKVSPFSEYKNYFNVFTIKVPSNESGADHPGTANDEPVNPDPVVFVDTYFNATFDAAGIHRLLTVNQGRVFSVASDYFLDFDQILVLVNSDEYGGSGGNIAVSSTHSNANEIAIHEMGHSFSDLADEYYAGDSFAREDFNMTKETDPQVVKWKSWHGDFGVGIYQHCCGGNSSEWYRPHQSCQMRSLGNDFCVVCREQTVETIHELTSLIQAKTPDSDTIMFSDAPISIAVELLSPLPNTIKSTWLLDGELIASNVSSVEIMPDQIDSDNSKLEVFATDTTAYVRIEAHDILHNDFRNWTLIRSTVSSAELDQNLVKIYPNPARDILHVEVTDILNYQVSLLSNDGRLIFSEKNQTKIDVGHLSPGTYLLEVKEQITNRSLIQEVIIN